MKGAPLHPAIEAAIQEIDAALFNGDAFDAFNAPASLAHLKHYVARWQRHIDQAEEAARRAAAREQLRTALSADLAGVRGGDGDPT